MAAPFCLESDAPTFQNNKFARLLVRQSDKYCCDEGRVGVHTSIANQGGHSFGKFLPGVKQQVQYLFR